MIRSYKPEDLKTIMDIGNRAWRKIYTMFRKVYGDELFELICPNEETVKGEQIKTQCKQHPEWVYICEEENKIVGFITFQLDRETKIAAIGNNARDPSCNLKGIGQQMYRAVMDYLRQEGMLYARVGTGLDEAHAPARMAYERAGFNMSHEDVTYYMKL